MENITSIVGIIVIVLISFMFAGMVSTGIINNELSSIDGCINNLMNYDDKSQIKNENIGLLQSYSKIQKDVNVFNVFYFGDYPIYDVITDKGVFEIYGKDVLLPKNIELSIKTYQYNSYPSCISELNSELKLQFEENKNNIKMICYDSGVKSKCFFLG
ncbi:hypothetical protein [Xenorhabdus bovienii]|uniref:hypothetical protein n=1 Tax=Xenorhabdus bovienii TaxID=40576 RepID=UPI0023B21800|nr:hypothetical protein [Xenorhabdus bovienii]MDE9544153.1 hypothetical protein [Xenorhabdus bovienii]